ncbi:hypothetical protein BH11ACT4_BH11ACT4_04520 [soil metagenome]
MKSLRSVGACAVLAIGLTGCSADGLGEPSSPQAQYAHDQVQSLVHAIEYDRHEDIDGYARAAVAQDRAEQVILVGIRSRAAAAREDVFGTLTFLVADLNTGATAQRSEPHCFDVDFNWFGPTGRTRSDSGVMYVHCPQDPRAVVPPVDTSIHLVLAENAQDIAIAVLTAAQQEPDVATIEQAIAAQLTPPTAQYEHAAPPRVIVDGENIGVAMGDAKHCVLVNRVAGVVAPLYVPKVLLQEGEYGCRPETALTDPELLKPPH